MVKCWFESFGCNHTCLESVIDDHLASNMKLHFDLVSKSFDALQQTIRQYQVSLFIYDFNKKKYEEIRKLNLENEILKVELQLKGKKDEEIAHLKRQLDQYQKDNLQLNSAHQKIIIIKQKTTLVEMEKLKKDIESKHNEIQKIKEEIELKEKQIIEKKQMNEQKENIMNDNSSKSIINTSSTLDFELVSSFKLLNTFAGHTSAVWNIDYSTFDDCQFICSGSSDQTVRVWDIDKNKQIQLFNGHSSDVYCVKFSSYYYNNHRQH
ncbi:Serine/Threonine protein kinase, partial [Reticulomyxa filosa]